MSFLELDKYKLAQHQVASPVAIRLAHHLRAAPGAVPALPWQDEPKIQMSRGETLYEQGGSNDDIYFLEDGWAIGSVSLDRNRRFIYRIYQPGDIIGLEDLNWSYATTTVQIVRNATLTRMSIDHISPIMQENSELARAMFGLVMLDQVVAMDRARANSRLNTPGALLHLLLQTEARTFFGEPQQKRAFVLPLSQQEIADALGVSAVHVSRSLQTLVDTGLISRQGRKYVIENREGAEAYAEFIDRHHIRG